MSTAKSGETCPVCNGNGRRQKCPCCKGAGTVKTVYRFKAGDIVSLAAWASVNAAAIAGERKHARVLSIVNGVAHLDAKLGGYWTWEVKYLLPANKNILTEEA